MEAELMNTNHSWGTIQMLANDGQGWRSFVAALYASWPDGVVMMMMMPSSGTYILRGNYLVEAQRFSLKQ